MSDVTYRWIDGPTCSDADWERIDSILATRGWMSLARSTSKILVAEHGDKLLGFSVLQMTPQVGPLFVAPSARGSGVAEDLSDQMLDFLVSIQARGWFVVADSPFVSKICDERGMTKLQSPVYVAGGMGGGQ